MDFAALNARAGYSVEKMDVNPVGWVAVAQHGNCGIAVFIDAERYRCCCILRVHARLRLHIAIKLIAVRNAGCPHDIAAEWIDADKNGRRNTCRARGRIRLRIQHDLRAW